jgi:AcrR family transcriptional regulator
VATPGEGERARPLGRERTRRRREQTAPVWTRPEPGSRRPRYSREQIAATALEIADREGFEAVSMRRLAAELGAGTMTLYHYVATKNELLALMDDAIMGEVLIPDGEMPSHWREAVAEIARRSKAAFLRHPWSFEALAGAGIGPNGTRHFEQSLGALASLDLSLEEALELIGMVDDYTFGYVVRTIGAHGAPVEGEEIEAVLEYFSALVGDEEFPHLTRMLGDASPREMWDRVVGIMFDEERFERGLQRLLDGIELDLDRRGHSSSSARRR